MAKPSNEYLDEERRKLWQKVHAVEDELNNRIDQEISKTAGDYSAQAKQASKMASEFRNKSEIGKNKIADYLADIEDKVNKINDTAKSASVSIEQIRNNELESKRHNDASKQSLDEIESKKDSIEETIEKLENIFEGFDTLTENLSSLTELFTNSEETSLKIEALHKSLLSRKKEIDQLYYEVFGYTEKESGVDTEIKGLKDNLEKAYVELDNKISFSNSNIESFQKDTEQQYTALQDSTKKNYEDHITNWDINYRVIESKIQALLPNALTAGLSSAYSEKKQVELDEYKRLNITFIIAIFGLISISIIPFIVSYISFSDNKPLEKVLLDMPRLVLSILPLYVPILWVAYSSNRKMNLSKRLSEEYSHKEVLSKTFEGLSTQIKNISNAKVSEDLQNKLLYNILEVSSENPGKLISDYNKSDHPLMDALDKSVQLATAFEKLEKIPGLSKLAEKLNRKSKTILENENEKANTGLDTVETEA
jgi:CRISPR type III-B/RAMP module RAMP protein Cmr1